MVVVFPEPVAPTRAMVCPGLASSDMWVNADTPSQRGIVKDFSMILITSIRRTPCVVYYGGKSLVMLAHMMYNILDSMGKEWSL